MAGSRTTTRLSTLHVESTQTWEDHAYLLVDSAGTLEAAGDFLKAVDSTASASPANVADGQLSIVSHSGDSIILAYRSGDTVYKFTNDEAVT